METTSTQNLLLVEDDVDLAELTARYLAQHGFDVAVESNGLRAIDRILASQPAVVILDVGLPGCDGFEVCRRVMPHYSGVLLMLTARDEDVDQILGLELGADDYLTKPVQPRLLLARLRARLRRTPVNLPQAGEIQLGPFRINQRARAAWLAGNEVALTTAEFDLLWFLAERAGEVVSREALIQGLRGIGYDGMDRSVDTRICRLRRKFGDDPDVPSRIKTIRGKGYLLSKVDW
ncbi:winged helix-turn-helix domain-containing protein [Chitinivorax sp. B]|uniref:winged helix-turn-helix domain-containing protein n=1 Tax=Chitinivorax sp. B TaxID=2502235 RepID=UPI0010F7DED4|nr:winged helix-turn-helix domain-containing protein [Chitinivorax sp. B]